MQELMVIGISVIWLFLITVAALGGLEQSSRELLIGLAVNCNLIFFYGAPLSKIATVLETKSSKSIHKPTMITSLLNGSLWLTYGVAVEDCFIAVPNGFGALLGVLQLLLCLVYPKRRRPAKYGEDGIVKSPSSQSLQSLYLPEESTPLI